MFSYNKQHNINVVLAKGPGLGIWETWENNVLQVDCLGMVLEHCIPEKTAL